MNQNIGKFDDGRTRLRDKKHFLTTKSNVNILDPSSFMRSYPSRISQALRIINCDQQIDYAMNKYEDSESEFWIKYYTSDTGADAINNDYINSHEMRAFENLGTCIEGTFFRGSEIKEPTPKGLFSDRFRSFSKSLDIALRFSIGKSLIGCKGVGIDIAKYSVFPKEEEVILFPDYENCAIRGEWVKEFNNMVYELDAPDCIYKKTWNEILKKSNFEL